MKMRKGADVSGAALSGPLPLVGRVRVGVVQNVARPRAKSYGPLVARSGTTPTPGPSPQGGGERALCPPDSGAGR